LLVKKYFAAVLHRKQDVAVDIEPKEVAEGLDSDDGAANWIVL